MWTSTAAILMALFGSTNAFTTTPLAKPFIGRASESRAKPLNVYRVDEMIAVPPGVTEPMPPHVEPGNYQDIVEGNPRYGTYDNGNIRMDYTWEDREDRHSCSYFIRQEMWSEARPIAYTHTDPEGIGKDQMKITNNYHNAALVRERTFDSPGEELGTFFVRPGFELLGRIPADHQLCFRLREPIAGASAGLILNEGTDRETSIVMRTDSSFSSLDSNAVVGAGLWSIYDSEWRLWAHELCQEITIYIRPAEQ